MTMYGALHPKSDVNRIYLPRGRGGRGLISCEKCILSEENNMGWYVMNSVEPLLKAVKSAGIVHVVNCVKPKEFKKKRVEDGEKSWREKKMYGQFLREQEETDVDKDITWDWTKKSDLKAGTEALIFAAQEQTLRTNFVKFHVDKTVEPPLCRMCNERGESVSHLVSECSTLAQREYKRRHDIVARIIHWELCRLYELERADKLFEHQPNSVLETDRTKVLWDFNIQYDYIIEARRPDIVIVEKEEKVCKIIDIAIPENSRVAEKEREKVEKYQDLKR